MIKILITASIIFGAVIGLGFAMDGIPVGQMANGLQSLSDDLLTGLQTFGLTTEAQNNSHESVIDDASLSFEFEVQTVDPDKTPNTQDEYFINAVTQCNFHSDEDIEDTCVVCELEDLEGRLLGEGRTDLDIGYEASDSVPVDISGIKNDEQIDVANVHAVTLKVCVPQDGCSDVYWRSNLETWEQTGISPDYKFKEVFGLSNADDLPIAMGKTDNLDPTFEQAINAEGGDLNGLIRNSATALLNSQSDIEYPLTSEQVVLNFYEAYSSGNYTETNELFAHSNDQDCALDDGLRGPP